MVIAVATRDPAFAFPLLLCNPLTFLGTYIVWPTALFFSSNPLPTATGTLLFHISFCQGLVEFPMPFSSTGRSKYTHTHTHTYTYTYTHKHTPRERKGGGKGGGGGGGGEGGGGEGRKGGREGGREHHHHHHHHEADTGARENTSVRVHTSETQHTYIDT